MAKKKQDSSGDGRTARGGEPRGARQHTTATRARKQASDGIGSANQRPAQEAPAAPDGATQPPPGLDEARHAAAQKAAHGAEVLRQAYVPASLATALGMGDQFDGSACRAYLDRLAHDAGNP